MSAHTPPGEEHLLDTLEHIFGHVVGLHPLPDSRPWSCTYAVKFRTGDMVYLKGTPRHLPEAMTTAFLSTCCPTYIPTVLHSDLIPDGAWRWFLTAYAGDCSHTELPPHLAEQAAFALGQLQRVVHTTPVLARMLPTCLPHQLRQIALYICDWLIQHSEPNIKQCVQTYRARITSAAPYFATLTRYLAILPASCVHGDFWPGNIAVQHNTIKMIDWAEALWGIGGVSVWNLLLTSDATLAQHTVAVWEAYQQGWKRRIPQEYIHATRVAFDVSMLIVDCRYVQWHPVEIDVIPGMIKTLQQVVRHLE